MNIEENRTRNEAAVRELIDGFVKAIRAKDINGVMSVFATEVVSFDLGPPAATRRRRAIHKTLAGAFRVIPGSD
jgi:ketosteroid isomerase-like protein